MVIKSFYVLQDRGNKMFKTIYNGGSVEDINEADHYLTRSSAYQVAGDNYDVMVYKITLEKDRF